MKDISNGQKGRRRPSKNVYTTKSGKSIKLNRSLGERIKARKNARLNRRAAYLSTLPKNRWKRLAYRLHPKRVIKYWFSRQGLVMALKLSGIAIVVGFFLAVGVFAYFRKDLPKINDISGTKIGGSNTYYDRTGQTVLWQDYDAVKRVPVQGDQISTYMKNATVAIEDKNFYNHGAFDVRGILRAGINDVVGSGGTQGGSTITQQLVKNDQGWIYDHTVSRKLKEIILAVELEREYSKDDILKGYLNLAPYGGVEYGVEAAARDYFNTSAKDLTLTQAAMLAAIPKAPSVYSPYSSIQFNASAGDTFDSDALKARMNYILDQMVSQKMITKQQADDAKKVDVIAQVKPLQSKYQGIKSPYFVLAAKKQLENKYGSTTVLRGGWKIITTLDLGLQTKAEQLVADNVANLQSRTKGLADEQATVTEDVQTGQIVALVGGVDFTQPVYGQRNYASSILIPPGSSFKPYDYTTLIENNNNVGASSVMYDQDTPLPGYACTNHGRQQEGGNCLKDYDFLQPGAITLRYALGGSRNVPAVKAMLSAVPNDSSSGKVASINKVISTATAMMDNPYVKGNTYNCYGDEQLTETTQCYGASAIGDGAFLHLDDHVNGLATLGRLGSAIPRSYILKITDSTDKSIFEWEQPKGKQVIRQDSAYIIDNMASDPNASYLPVAGGYKFHRDNGSTFAIKTGTTNDGFDGLMTSWSSKYAVVSWVGNHERNVDISKYGASMEQLTMPLTKGMMEAAHAGKPPASWTQPSDIKVAAGYIQRNHIHYGDVEPGPTTDLYPSWYAGGSKTGTTQTFDKVSGKVATSCTPDLAKDTQANGNPATFNIDIFNGGKTSTNTTTSGGTTTANDDVHNCSDSPPSITITAPSTCDASGCTVTATVTQGTHPLSDAQYAQFPGTVNFSVNGQVVKSFGVSDSPSTVSFIYTPSASGQITMTAQVIDSVLYQATDTATITAEADTGVTMLSAKVIGLETVFTWSGGDGGMFKVYKTSDPSTALCADTDHSCSTLKSKADVGTSVYVVDSSGHKSAAILVTN